MFDPQLAEEARIYATRHAPQTDILLGPTGASWAARLGAWFAACRHRPATAFRRDRLCSAIDDLVTLQLACEAVAADPAGLRITDRGGSVAARRAQAALFRLVGERDPVLARQLALRAGARLTEARRTLLRLIAARA